MALLSQRVGGDGFGTSTLLGLIERDRIAAWGFQAARLARLARLSAKSSKPVSECRRASPHLSSVSDAIASPHERQLTVSRRAPETPSSEGIALMLPSIRRSAANLLSNKLAPVYLLAILLILLLAVVPGT